MGNYCIHGTYVGGMGADYMCGHCEDGVDEITYSNWVKNMMMRDWAADMVNFICNDVLVYEDWADPILHDDIKAFSKVLDDARKVF